MNKQDQFVTLFSILNKAFDEGRLRNLKVSRTTAGDCNVGFEWVTWQPFELLVDFKFDECHAYLGFNPEEALLTPIPQHIPIEDWRMIVIAMEDRLAAVERFCSQVRNELLKHNTQA